MKALQFFTLFLLFTPLAHSANFPSHWWGPTDTSSSPVPRWEILPEAGTPGETVVLSKRNELGILSNFAPTSFTLDGKTYASLEGFWQSLKYPEGPKDLRYKSDTLPYKREDVEKMTAFAAKKAGSLASKLMQKYSVDWVSYKGRNMPYRTTEKGEHYQLIRRAMKAKLNQNQSVKTILLSTGNLKLLPDHQVSNNRPPAWEYDKIWMEERASLQAK